MTREEARKAAEVMKAYADGKEIEFKTKKAENWRLCEEKGELFFNWQDSEYRIKKKPTYRPFKNKKECWNEIQKHSPFGWVKTKHNNYGLISYIRTLNNIEEVMINVASYDFKEAFDVFTFIDGTPFGIKEE